MFDDCESEENVRKNISNLFYKNEDLPSYLSKIFQCRRTYDESFFKYERDYFSKELDKRIKDVAFQKIMEVKSDVIKARAYYDAAIECGTIEEAFNYLIKENCPLGSSSVLSKLEKRIPSIISDVLECLTDILEDLDVFELFIKCDEVENRNSKSRDFRDFLEERLIFNDEGKLSKEVLDEIREKVLEFTRIDKSFLS